MPDAQATAAIRAALRRTGQAIDAYDPLIAEIGLARGLSFVTSHVEAFDRVGGLQIERWR